MNKDLQIGYPLVELYSRRRALLQQNESFTIENTSLEVDTEPPPVEKRIMRKRLMRGGMICVEKMPEEFE